MNNIILIKPPLSKEQVYGTMSGVGAYDPPLGIAYLASNLKQNKIDVDIIDANAMNLTFDKSVDLIAEKSPKYVGISAVTMDIYSAADLAHKIKERNKDIITILGGVHLTAVPKETMDKFPQFDLGVIGEGETTLVELINALNNKAAIDKIDGLAYRKDREVVFTQPRKLNNNLDSYPPPAWDIIPGFPENYSVPPYSTYRSPSCSVITSRGCGRSCTYCFQGTMGRFLRFHSAEYVMNIINYLHSSYGVRDLRFVDDQFLAHKKRTEKLCELLINEAMDITFSCLARIDTITPQLLSLLKKAGCRQINFGIESGSQMILNAVKKEIKLNEVLQSVKWTKEAGIKTMGYFMIGFPHEKEENIEETISFSKRLPLDDVSFFFLTPFPGTELYNTAHEHGKFDRDWKSLSMFIEPCFIPAGLTKEKMFRYRRKAVVQFYLRPRIIFSYLRRLSSFSQIKVLGKVVITFLKFLITRSK